MSTQEPENPLIRTWNRIATKYRLVAVGVLVVVSLFMFLDNVAGGLNNMIDLVARFRNEELGDLGITAAPDQPETLAQLFPIHVVIRTSQHVIPDINVNCELDRLKAGQLLIQGLSLGSLHRNEDFEPDETLHVFCRQTVGGYDSSKTEEAKLTIDLDFTLDDHPGRFFAWRTFQLSKDRYGRPSWEMVDSRTGPVSERPTRPGRDPNDPMR